MKRFLLSLLLVTILALSVACGNSSQVREQVYDKLKEQFETKLYEVRDVSLIYEKDAPKVGEIANKLRVAKYYSDSIVKRNEELRRCGYGSRELLTGRTLPGPWGGNVVYELTDKARQEEYDAVRLEGQLTNEYSWAQVCHKRNSELLSYEDELISILSGLDENYTLWEVTELKDGTYMVGGYSLGFSRGALSKGNWYYYPTANKIEYYDRNAQELYNKLNVEIESPSDVMDKQKEIMNKSNIQW